ncbi:MAG: hypothetical protein ACRD2A_22110, partial [Vicinamibacterales bacterium]
MNEATGFAVETDARNGRFSEQGLEIGGPYVVLVRRIGFKPLDRRIPYLALGQALELQILLSPVASVIDTVRVTASERKVGITTTISDSLLHRLPTLNRDMYDFVGLAPQISTKVAISSGGISGGGVNMRFNNFLIDGVTDRFATGNSSTATQGGKSVPLEAVKEYQVLLAPFDVRFGDFAGALVNSVTRSGTNAFHGSAFAYGRNDGLARPTADSLQTPYRRTQSGFSVGGPLVRDRLHFFLAPEFQRITSPASGPFLGQAANASQRVPLSADVSRFLDLMRGWGLAPGSPGAVMTSSASANVFGRLDLALPSLNSRAVLLDSYARTDNTPFSRAHPDTFSLSSYQVRARFSSHLISAQLHTNVRGGSYNALTL